MLFRSRILPPLSIHLSDGGGIGFDFLLPPGETIAPDADALTDDRTSRTDPRQRLFRVDEVTRQPVRTRYVQPSYPRAARRRGIDGTVAVEFTIDAEGMVRDAVVASDGGQPTLADAALEAVRLWRFRPALREGQAVAVRLRQPIRFTLDD